MKTLFRTVLVILFTGHLLPLRAQVPVLNSYPSATATILLDFDGMYLSGTVWNFSGPFTCNPAGLTTGQMTEVFNRVAEDYRPFNVNITTDESRYSSAPVDMRMRVIITSSYEWYGSGAGGVAYTNSFKWGDGTPCFVFSSLFGYDVKDIAEAASHEAGHTLGLRHQSTYDGSCTKTSDYNWGQGTGEIGWAPIMGAGYYQNLTLWHNGPNSNGCTSYQSDLDIISSSYNGFGFRTDDNAGDFTGATNISFDAGNQFNISGVVEKTSDSDMFKFTVPVLGSFTLDAIPYNVGTGNSGSDLDMNIDLYDQGHTLLASYNPGNQLSSIIDTLLTAGTYYINVDGRGNIYATDYGSLGSYSLQGSLTDATLLPVRNLSLNGYAEANMHYLNWTVQTDVPVISQEIEFSYDGKNFRTLAVLPGGQNQYTYAYNDTRTVQYMLVATDENGKKTYSNIITMRPGARSKPSLSGNIINSSLVITSPSEFTYYILDNNGRMLNRGRIQKGFNQVDAGRLPSGMYLIRFVSDTIQWTEKFVKQ